MKSKKSKGKEKSTLVEIAQNFINFMVKSDGKEVNITQIERNHVGSKRRLYDVINVLSGINYVERSSRAKIRWIGDQIGVSEESTDLSSGDLDVLSENIDRKLEELILSQEFKQFGYLTKDNISDISDKSQFFYALSGPPDLTIELEAEENDNLKLTSKSEIGEVVFTPI